MSQFTITEAISETRPMEFYEANSRQWHRIIQITTHNSAGKPRKLSALIYVNNGWNVRPFELDGEQYDLPLFRLQTRNESPPLKMPILFDQE